MITNLGMIPLYGSLCSSGLHKHSDNSMQMSAFFYFKLNEMSHKILGTILQMRKMSIFYNKVDCRYQHFYFSFFLNSWNCNLGGWGMLRLGWNYSCLCPKSHLLIMSFKKKKNLYDLEKSHFEMQKMSKGGLCVRLFFFSRNRWKQAAKMKKTIRIQAVFHL